VVRGVDGWVCGLYELRRMFVDRFDPRRATATVMMLAGPVLVLMVILYQTGGAIGTTGNEWAFGWKPLWFALSLNGYNVMLSAGSMVTLIGLLGYLSITGALELSGAGKWIGVGFL